MTPLTKHPSGSFLELLTIAIPLILTSLSGSLFVFVDRIILSYYSFEAVKAVSGVGVVFATLYYPGCAIASITEVFCGQYNGAGQHNKVAAPVWQMIWFSILSALFYLPIGLWGDHVFLAQAFIDTGGAYYQILVIGSPLFLLHAAIAGFFVGIGRPSIVTIASVTGNAIKIALTYLLVFGIGNIPSLGIKGSAIASIVAEALQVLLLVAIFFNSENNRTYHTRQISFNLSIFWEELKIGIPGAIGHTFEIAGWAFLSNLRAGLGSDYIMVMTISGTSFLLFTFYTEGLQKAITALTANLIGSRNFDTIEKTKRSAYKMHLLFLGFTFIPFVALGDLTISPFIDPQSLTEQTLLAIRLALLGNFIFMVFDGYFWIYSGILTAGGDTKTVMVVNSLSVWLFCVLPAYVWLNYFPSESYSISLYSFPIYSAIVTFILYFRVRSNQWIKLDLAKK